MPRPGALLFLGLLLAARPLQAQDRIGYFFELGGNGGFASINLDARLTSRLHARAGAGTILWPTVPVTVSYLIGSRSHGLELGGGATVMHFPRQDHDAPFAQRFAEFITTGKGAGTVTLLTGILGYRHESASGSTFRAGFTPYFHDGRMLAWFGLSLGGRF